MIVFNALSTAVALATAAAAQGTFTPCTAPYDVCGWTLRDGVHNYPPEILAAAARAAGQDSDNRDVIYNSIYNCLDADGDIAWNHLCQNGCNAGGDTGPNAECR